MKRNSLLVVALWVGLVLASRMLKLTFPVGGHAACLTFFSVAFPLIAYFFSPTRSLPLAGGVWFAMHLLHPVPLTMGIPTFLATLSWQASHKKGWSSIALHLLFPLGAMALFITKNPAAWTYSLYWLIPVISLFFSSSLIARALQSTFSAHAAGSLIWAYLAPLSSAQWLSLIPVVAVERLLAVALAVAAIKIIATVVSQRREDANRLVDGHRRGAASSI